nr:AI-2E family transporter [Clostridia bacterium]
MKDISWTTCLRLGVTAAAAYLICAGRDTLSAAMASLSPLLIGGGVACVVDIPMSALEKRLFPGGGWWARLVCLTLSLAGVGAAAAWLAGAILPEALQCLTLLTARLPDLIDGLLTFLRGVFPNGQQVAAHALQLAMEEALSWAGNAADALTALTTGAMNAALALIFALYLLWGKERIRGQIACLLRRVLGENAQQRASVAAAALRDALRAYITGQCLEAMILGCLCLMGMLLLRLPGVLPISAMAGVTALFPLIGPPLAAGIGALLLLPESASAAVTFTVFFLALQQVESWFIAPRVVGNHLGLSPVWTLAALVMGGGLFGVPGALLAVPVAAAAKNLLICDS